MKKLELKPIGVLKTPYKDSAPYQPLDGEGEEFLIVLDEKYVDGLEELEKFRYVYVIFFADRVTREPSMRVSPSWAGGKRVGLFASRSPARPNPIGISVVRVLEVSGNRIRTSGLDVFDGTPVLDIKPYIKDLDSKADANYGWLEDLDDMEHLTLHIKGIPHDY